MSSIKPIKLYSHAAGPNPWKVAIILEELNVPYESEWIDMGEIKKEPFISVNPNGRVPAIEDPNTGITLWESGAIIDYLLDTYDKDNDLQYTSSPEKWDQRAFCSNSEMTNQRMYWFKAWADFQKSGQGPYFGQLTWFQFLHHEKNITSAIERYRNEVKRVLGVIDAHLKKRNRPYLVGEKACYADLMFIPWNNVAVGIVAPDYDAEFKETMPNAYEWHQKLLAREGVKKALAKKAEAGKNAGH